MKKTLISMFAALSIAAISGDAEAKGKAKKAAVREVPVTVTSNGFEPAEIKVKRGEKVRLVVTRKVERTCATEIVMKDLKIEKELPLEKPVTVELTPTRPGEIRFACAMDMIGGKVVVE